MFFAVLIWILLFQSKAIQIEEVEEEIFISASPKGKDENSCGTFGFPCHSIKHAISKCTANKCRITLDGEATSLYTVDEEIEISKDIVIQGYSSILSKPIIIAKQGSNVRHAFKINSSNQTLHLKSVVLKGIGLASIEQDGIVNASDCYVLSTANAPVFGGSMTGNIVIDLEHCDFQQFYSVIESNMFRSLKLTINSCQFQGKVPVASKGLLLNPGFRRIGSLWIEIIGSKFKQLVYVLKIDVSTLASNVKVLIDNSLFENNGLRGHEEGAAVSYSGGGSLTVTDSTFRGNTAESGGAMFIYVTDNVLIKSCSFVNNFVHNHGGALFLVGTKVIIQNSNFSVNWASSSSTSSILAGIGGAISSTNGTVLSLNQCQFNKNFAVLLGGTIFHNGLSLSIIKSVMYASNILSQQGSLIYSTTQVTYDQTLFFTEWSEYSRKSEYNPAFIFHSGFNSRFLLKLKKNVTFHCQRGHKLETSFLSFQSRGTTLGIVRCLPCAQGTYSMDREFATWDNSKEPVHHHKITCLECPLGGKCDHGVRSIPNFWGWKTKNNMVKFVACRSAGFCCSSPEECTRFNSCEKNRRGIICGQCKRRFSESLFSDTCIRNEECEGKEWVLVLVILVALFYVLVLMYFKEIFSKLKRFLDMAVSGKGRKGILLERTFSIEYDSFEDENFTVISSKTNSNVNPEVFQENDEHQSKLEEPLLTNYIEEEINIQEDNEVEDEEAVIPYTSSSSSFGSSCTDDSNSILVSEANNFGNDCATNCKENKISTHAKQERRKRKLYSYLFGVLKILAFFYQMQAIIKIPSTLENSFDFAGPLVFKEFVTGIFNMRTVGTYYIIDICVRKNFDNLEKQFSRISFILLIIFIVIVLYLVWLIKVKIVAWCANSFRRHKIQGKFDLRLRCCFLQIILIGYSPVATSICKMTSCYEINGKSRLFIAGQYECNQWWYYLSYFIFVCWTAPLFLAVFGANKLLRANFITNNEFFAVMIFPPFLIYYILRYFLTSRTFVGTDKEMLYRKQVLFVLEEPFLSQTKEKKSAWYWESVLLFRRLVLIWMYVQLIDPVARLYAMCIPLTLFLVHHLQAKPYNSRFLNFLETSSLILLCLLVALNLFWAYNYVTNVPVASSFRIAEVFLYIETTILALPLVMVVAAICFVFGRKLLLKVRLKKT